MQRIENAFIGLALGAVPVIVCFLAGWWIAIPFLPESRVFISALAGLVCGILIDFFFLKGWVQRAFSFKAWVWKAVYVFYSVGMFGFFMGVPVFHVLLAFPTGVFVGRWLAHTGADSARMRQVARRAAVFTTSVLGLVCLASATIALASPSTGRDLRGMLRLPFEVTTVMILALIVVGGAAILILNWWLTLRSAERAYACFAVRPASPALTRNS